MKVRLKGTEYVTREGVVCAPYAVVDVPTPEAYELVRFGVADAIPGEDQPVVETTDRVLVAVEKREALNVEAAAIEAEAVAKAAAEAEKVADKPKKGNKADAKSQVLEGDK